MHRHGYKGRKFGRERDQRHALLRGLAGSLVEAESVVTTLPKAKELVPYAEKLMTDAKAGTLAARRRLIGQLQSAETAHKLITELAPKLEDRTSGFFKLEHLAERRGDNTKMAKVSFVVVEAKKAVSKKTTQPAADKKEDKTAQPKATNQPVSQTDSKMTSVRTAAKRSGRRGER